jgi:hypothetical protein
MLGIIMSAGFSIHYFDTLKKPPVSCNTLYLAKIFTHNLIFQTVVEKVTFCTGGYKEMSSILADQ